VQKAQAHRTRAALDALQLAAVENRNLFAVILDSAKRCTLGQMTEALYAVGGKYRRNM